MSMEKRILIAFVASAVVFAVWTAIFPPPKATPKRPLIEKELPAAAENSAAEEGKTAAPSSEEASKPTKESAPAEEAVPGSITGERVEESVLENDVLKIVFSNQGACATSIVLKKYSGDEGEPLDLVQSVVHPKRSFPLQMVRAGTPDQRLYAVTANGRKLSYQWSDGEGLVVRKDLELAESGYGLALRIQASGAPNTSLSLGTGMRDTDVSERENRFATWGDAVIVRSTAKKQKTYRRQKIKDTEVFDAADLQLAGFEDTYFLDVYQPQRPLKKIEITALESEMPTGQAGKIEKQRKEKDQKKDAKVLRIDLLSPDGIFEGGLFLGPKEYDLLQQRNHGLEKTLRFGIFHPLAVISLKAVRWIYRWVGNWGLAIILLTVGIRILLFPLVHKSTVSMRKMQKVQPKIKAIQEKYRKNKKDPDVRAKMNQETMALYKQEGVNPVGGCLPTLIQLPILFALYTLFAHAIELRHAPFIWWIVDLSAKDPLYITPVLMTASMWLQQKLAPQAGDAQQMKMMRFMPLIFGVMFLGFPSGLVLYWLTNNVVTIMQQEITLHLIGERSRGGKKKSTKGGKK